MIFNYSFAPISEFMRFKGVVELDTDELASNLIFKYRPTIQKLSRRCAVIADYAVKHKHGKVYMKNYTTFHSYLKQAFQARGIRVFVPLYTDYEIDEELVGYNTLNKVVYFNEVGIIELSNLSVHIVEYVGQENGSYEFSSTKCIIMIEIDESLLQDIRSNNIIQHLLTEYNISITNIEDFLFDLRENFGSEILNTCMDLDSPEVSEFLNYST